MTSYCAAVAVDVSFDIIGVTRDRACRVSGEPKEAPSHLPTTTRGHSRLECSCWLESSVVDISALTLNTTTIHLKALATLENGRAMSLEYDENTRHLPRILCLHGSGTNARIFQVQCRRLSTCLQPYFRLVFAEAPFVCLPGPDVGTVFADSGPFKRWLADEKEHYSDAEVVATIDASLAAAMQGDTRAGATGPWVGLLGFSQGGKLAASLLYRQQRQQQPRASGDAWRFGVIMAGRGPTVCLDPETCPSVLLARPRAELLAPPLQKLDQAEAAKGHHVLRVPTLHVHGRFDPDLKYHKVLLHDYCEPSTARLLEWAGDHRVPLKPADVTPVVDGILKLAAATGV
ncbi:citrinin biosynthesis oxidoreductase CtnB [Pyricularia oryzae]|nr:citrinin biosynthesis oxidoreductase CtnB [Pyricularia oryzae]